MQEYVLSATDIVDLVFLQRREAAADVVTIRYSSRTGVCLEHLASQLRVFAKMKDRIGSFSAASNVSGKF